MLNSCRPLSAFYARCEGRRRTAECRPEARHHDKRSEADEGWCAEENNRPHEHGESVARASEVLFPGQARSLCRRLTITHCRSNKHLQAREERGSGAEGQQDTCRVGTRHGSHAESRMRENCTYGSMRGIRRKTAKHVLRVAEGRAGVPHGASRSTLHPSHTESL